MTETQASENGRNDVVAAAIAAKHKADDLREAAIKQLLAQREQIDQDLKALGYAGTLANGQLARERMAGSPLKQAANGAQAKLRFKGLPLAEIARTLLTENEILHGKEIEQMARAGGFKGGQNHFQTYMPTAFKRAGGFENIGKNRWRLNSEIGARR